MSRRSDRPRRNGSRPRVVPAVVGAWMALLALSGCVAPATDSGAYRQNAAAALRSALSEARTGALAVQARLDAKATNAYVDTVVTQSESALGPIGDSFDSVDPPSRRDDDLRDHVGTMLSDTFDALSAARIAVRREDRPGMRASVRDLTRLGNQLDQAERALA